MATLYDYLYVDLEKAISLYSQLTGGVVELRETQFERGESADNKRNYDFRVFRHDAGGTTDEREQDRATIKPHHALLQELETELSNSGYLLDLDTVENGETLKDERMRNILKSTLCVKCTGRMVIEDYDRLKKIADDFPEVVKLINQAAESTLKENPEYRQLEQQAEALEKTQGDRNQKARAKQQSKEIRKSLEEQVKKNQSVDSVPQWILDGMKTWIDAFLPSITNIRIYPFANELDEHIFGHFEGNNFTVEDPTAFHFTYGSFPTEEFTMIGVITSVPLRENEVFSPLEEFQKSDLKDYELVESAFRGMFRGFDDLEAMIRTCRFPRVMVHPILVYRQSMPNKALQRTSR
jgi:hypothetical protein